MKSVKKPEVDNKRKRYLKGDEDGENELWRFANACKEVVLFRVRNKTLKKSPGSAYLYYIVHLALLTGLRAGEIKKMKWVDIQLNTGELRLYDTKNGESYTILLVDQAVDLLREHAIGRRQDSEYVFPSKNGKKAVDWKRPFKEAILFAGLKDFKFHDTRHTFISYGAMSGIPLGTLQEMARHKDIQSTIRYKHLSPHYVNEQAQEMVNKRFKLFEE